MSSRTVNIAEFKAHLTDYLAEAEKGGEIVVARRNVPIARLEGLSRPLRKNRTRVGSMKGTVRLHGEIVSPAISADEWEMNREAP